MTTVAGFEGGVGTRSDVTQDDLGRGESSGTVEVVVGPYRVLEVLGEGASSRVYSAEHLEDGRRVALKVMLPCHRESLTKMMRFALECELLSRVQHPNVVQILEHGQCSERYAALELLSGETLRERLVREGTLSLRETLEIALQLASALQAVHETGVIHCDVKPDNVHLSAAGLVGSGDVCAKLFDFDAARWIDEHTGASAAILPAGAVLGTPGYMAPEQEQGVDVDHRADIYAFGVTLYEMLTSASPYARTTLGDMVRAKLFGTPKSLRSFSHLSELPPSLDALVRACVERVPDKRPGSMAEVRALLRDAALDVDSGVGLTPRFAALVAA